MNQTTYTESIYTIGSGELFELRAFKDGLAWDLTGATVLLKLAKPDQSLIVLTASTVYNGGALVPWTVIGPPSAQNANWFRAWDITDAQGVRQISVPIKFYVESSPI